MLSGVRVLAFAAIGLSLASACREEPSTRSPTTASAAQPSGASQTNEAPVTVTTWKPPDGYHVAAVSSENTTLQLYEIDDTLLMVPTPARRAVRATCSPLTTYRLSSGTIRAEAPTLDAPSLGAVYDEAVCSKPDKASDAKDDTAGPCGVRTVTAMLGTEKDLWLLTRVRPARDRYSSGHLRGEVWHRKEGAWSLSKRFAPGEAVRGQVTPRDGGLLVLVESGRRLQRFEAFGAAKQEPLPVLTPLEGHRLCKVRLRSADQLKQTDGGVLLLVGEACTKSGVGIERWEPKQVNSVFGLGPSALVPLGPGGAAVQTEILSDHHVRVRARRGDGGHEVNARFASGKWSFEDGPLDAATAKEPPKPTQYEVAGETVYTGDRRSRDGAEFVTAVRARGRTPLAHVLMSSKPVTRQLRVPDLEACVP